MPKRADDKPEDTNKPWMIRDVPERTRHNVKVFATLNNLTIAQALAHLVEVALELERHGERNQDTLHVVINTKEDAERLTDIITGHFQRGLEEMEELGKQVREQKTDKPAELEHGQTADGEDDEDGTAQVRIYLPDE